MSTITSKQNDTLPKASLRQQLSFLNALPYDVVIKIVSFWTQQDCLTCMAVCRNWYHMIPQFTHNIWREIQLHSGDIHLDHQRRQRCLGGHVKRVVLLYMTPILLMQRLVDWDCTKVEDLGKIVVGNDDGFSQC
ncbi:hypothetical protein BJV82DRAFT_295975 [Fennellomyces sp. T-0311]|nr:hypothetical protein BJV82DRAFT_295975 [Fennellomyces sp. T-0311]